MFQESAVGLGARRSAALEQAPDEHVGTLAARVPLGRRREGLSIPGFHAAVTADREVQLRAPVVRDQYSAVVAEGDERPQVQVPDRRPPDPQAIVAREPCRRVVAILDQQDVTVGCSRQRLGILERARSTDLARREEWAVIAGIDPASLATLEPSSCFKALVALAPLITDFGRIGVTIAFMGTYSLGGS